MNQNKENKMNVVFNYVDNETEGVNNTSLFISELLTHLREGRTLCRNKGFVQKDVDNSEGDVYVPISP